MPKTSTLECEQDQKKVVSRSDCEWVRCNPSHPDILLVGKLETVGVWVITSVGPLLPQSLSPLAICVLLLSFQMQATQPNFSLGCPTQVQVERGLVAQPSVLVLTWGPSNGYVDLDFILSGLPDGVTGKAKMATQGPTLRMKFGDSFLGAFTLYVGDDAPIGEFPIVASATALNDPMAGTVRSCQFTLSIKQLEKFITIGLSTSTVQVGDKVTISGQAGYHVPLGDVSGMWFVFIEVAKGTGYERVGSTSLTDFDAYEYEWVPSQAGTYQVRTEWVYYHTRWLGPPSKAPDMILATSQIVVLAAEPASPSIPLVPALLSVGILAAIAIAVTGVILRKRADVPRPAIELGVTTGQLGRICKSCGSRNPENAANYCVRCGARLSSPPCISEARKIRFYDSSRGNLLYIKSLPDSCAILT